VTVLIVSNNKYKKFMIGDRIVLIKNVLSSGDVYEIGLTGVIINFEPSERFPIYIQLSTGKNIYVDDSEIEYIASNYRKWSQVEK